MQRLRRLASLMFLPLGLQLVLSAKAVACVGSRDEAGTSAAAMPAMPGMNMPASATPSGSHPSKPLPCNRPFGNGDCQALAACAAGALVSAEFVAPAAATPEHSTIQPLIVLAPASFAAAPELPPPRA